MVRRSANHVHVVVERMAVEAAFIGLLHRRPQAPRSPAPKPPQRASQAGNGLLASWLNPCWQWAAKVPGLHFFGLPHREQVIGPVAVPVLGFLPRDGQRVQEDHVPAVGQVQLRDQVIRPLGQDPAGENPGP